MDNNYEYDVKSEGNYDELSEEEQLNQHISEQQNQNASGLSITSLILGISGLVTSLACFGFVLGIPAVICGHLALGKVKRKEAGGGGMAIAGLVTGYLSLATIFILPAMLLPALSNARESARKISCTNNLKQIGIALRMYSNVYGEEFPPYNGVKGLDLLRSEGFLEDPNVFTCPSSETTPAQFGTPLTDETCDYDYVGGLNEGSAYDIGIAYDKGHNHDKYGNILYIDGRVKGYAGANWKSNMLK